MTLLNPINDHLLKPADYDLSYMKEHFDLIVTYRKSDAVKYGLVYHPSWFSKIDIPRNENHMSDVFFVGTAKYRLPLLHDIYAHLTKSGLHCSFFINKVPENEQLFKEQIVYNQPMPYDEVLSRAANTKCILEAALECEENTTLRAYEALAYNKKLITNLTGLKDTGFYDSDNIIIFQKASDIDINAIKHNWEHIDHKYNGEYSPVKLLEFIENQLYNRMT